MCGAQRNKTCNCTNKQTKQKKKTASAVKLNVSDLSTLPSIIHHLRFRLKRALRSITILLFLFFIFCLVNYFFFLKKKTKNKNISKSALNFKDFLKGRSHLLAPERSFLAQYQRFIYVFAGRAGRARRALNLKAAATTRPKSRHPGG